MIEYISDTTLQRPGTLSLDWVILTAVLLGTSLSVVNTAPRIPLLPPVADAGALHGSSVVRRPGADQL